MSSRQQIAIAKTKARSRLSNGHAFRRTVDLRSAWARRYRDLLSLHLREHLAGDCSPAEQAILKRACTLMVECERMEERFALAGEAQPHELELFQRTSNTLRRLLETLGLSRRTRDVTDLQTYLRAKAEAVEARE
jgi:hypothetical protein